MALPTDPNGPTGQLASWLAETALEDVPDAVRERASHVLLDGLGCALVGAHLPWSRTAVEAVMDLEGSGSATLIGWGRTADAPAAALLNGTFIQGFELDDFHPLGPVHSCAAVIPALLAAAEHRGGLAGSDALLASILGFEVGPRVGMALNGAEMLTRGWHSGAVFGPPAAAATAGKVWGLDAARFEDALGLAATQAGGLMAAQFEAMSKRMHHGFASRSGLYAAALAAGGYTGIKRVFEQRYGGFLSVFGEGHSPRPDKVSEGLGERWETERIAIKLYAAMGGLHAAVDAVLALAAERPIPPEGIDRIEVAVSEPVYHHGGWTATRPLTPVGAQMNLSYATAVAILDGAALVEQFAPARIDRDDVWELIERTVVAHDPEVDRMGRGTRLRIFMRDGSAREAAVRIPRGVLDNALTNGEIVDKFRRLTETVIDPPRRNEIERLTLRLEEVVDVRELTAVLAAPVRPALG